MQVTVGSSILGNSFEAGAETVRNAIKGLNNPKLGFLFSSEKHNQTLLLEGIKSVCPTLKVLGCTSSGAIMTPDGIISNEEGYAGILVLDDNDLKVGIAASERGVDPRTTGRRLAKEAMENAGKDYAPVAFAMFASPREEEQYIKGIQDIVGEIPIFGGSASDDEITGEWKVLGDARAFSDGCAIAFFYTTKSINTVYSHSYNETEKIGVITKLEGSRKILEIDGTPALNRYAEWTGLTADNLLGKRLLVSSLSHPLGVKNLNGNITLVRHPKAGNEDYSLTTGANVVNKSSVILMENDADGLISGCVKNINRIKEISKPIGLLLLHSAERRMFIGDRIDEDYVAIKNAVGDLPFIVAFTSGEYGHSNHSGACVSNLSLSFTSFSEQ